MSTKSTSFVIREMATTLRAYADRFDSAANALDDTGDFEICGDVANGVVNMLSNMRLDLLVNRPIREITKDKHSPRQSNNIPKKSIA